MRIDLGLGAEQTLHQLRCVHFQGKEGHRSPETHRRIPRHAQGKRGFTHSRTGSDDDQVGRVEAGGHLIEQTEAGCHTRDATFGALNGFQFLERSDHEVTHRHIVPSQVGFRQRKQVLLRTIQQVKHVGRLVKCRIHHAVADFDELAHQVLLGDDPCVVFDVGCRGDLACEFGEVIDAARSFQHSGGAEVIFDGEQVDRLRVLEKLVHRLINELVAFLVKHFGPDDVDDFVEGILFQEQCTQDSLLHFEGLWGNAS